MNKNFFSIIVLSLLFFPFGLQAQQKIKGEIFTNDMYLMLQGKKNGNEYQNVSNVIKTVAFYSKKEIVLKRSKERDEIKTFENEGYASTEKTIVKGVNNEVIIPPYTVGTLIKLGTEKSDSYQGGGKWTRVDRVVHVEYGKTSDGKTVVVVYSCLQSRNPYNYTKSYLAKYNASHALIDGKKVYLKDYGKSYLLVDGWQNFTIDEISEEQISTESETIGGKTPTGYKKKKKN